jgi:tetratricopeptide (TPR) repeat protein
MDTEQHNVIPPSPSQVGSKLLARFSDAEGLLLRTESPPHVESKAPPIPLKRFQELEQAIKHSPANETPYVELGRIYLDQHRWSDAKRVLDTGVQYCSDCEPLLLMREDLTLLLASQQLEEAKLKWTQSASEQNKYELEQTEINLANERIRICANRFARRPEQKEILIPWAVALRQLARHEEAVELLKKASEDAALRARASLQLGMCLQTLDRPLEALSAFRRAALFRAPPPDPAIRIRALELAIKIAEENHLLDSAIYYGEQLLLAVDTKIKPDVEKILVALKAKEL